MLMYYYWLIAWSPHVGHHDGHCTWAIVIGALWNDGKEGTDSMIYRKGNTTYTMHRVRAGCTPTHDGQVLHRPLDRPIMTPTSLGKSLGEKRMLNIYFVHWEIKKLWRNTHLKWHNDQETWDAERTLYMTLQRLWEFCPASYSRKDNEYRW